METEPNSLPKELQELQQQRGADYGQFVPDMRTQSHIIVSLLAHRLRFLGYSNIAIIVEFLRDRKRLDDIAPLFMSAVKLARAATGKYHPDHRVDAANYDWARDQIQKKEASNDQEKSQSKA